MRALCSVALVLAACGDRPEVRVICHNGNCAGAPDPSRDDTIEALQESLALRHDRRPAIDGVELDTVWDGATDTCIYGHDLASPARVPALAATDALVAHFVAQIGPTTADGGPFVVLMELKGFVDAAETRRHSPAQLAMHAQCAWQMYEALGSAFTIDEVEVIFSSFEPSLLREIRARRPPFAPTPFRFGGILGIPRPLDNQTLSLDHYHGSEIEVLEVHNQWLNDAQYEAIRTLDLELGFWMFSATVETFAAIEQYSPSFLVTNEALLFRRWLDY